MCLPHEKGRFPFLAVVFKGLQMLVSIGLGLFDSQPAFPLFILFYRLFFASNERVLPVLVVCHYLVIMFSTRHILAKVAQ